MTEKKIDAGAVVEKAESGKELTDTEQRAYDKAMADAAADKGYYPAAWSGRAGFRPMDGGDLWFDNERDVIEHVTRSRVYANLTGGVGA